MVDGGWDEWSECREFGVGHDSTETQVILGPSNMLGQKENLNNSASFKSGG